MIKKYILIGAVLLPVVAFANGESERQKYQTISPISFQTHISVMSTVEFLYFEQLMKGQPGIYDTTEKAFVPYEVRSVYHAAEHPWLTAEAEDYPLAKNKWNIGAALSDDSSVSGVTLYPSEGGVPVDSTGESDIIIHASSPSGASSDVRIGGGLRNNHLSMYGASNHVKISLKAQNEFTTASFRLSIPSGTVKSISVEAVVDGMLRTLVAERSFYGNTVNFPATKSKEWHVTLGYSDAVRISEIIADMSTQGSNVPVGVRFSAQPEHVYELLSDPGSTAILQNLPPHGSLLGDTTIVRGALGFPVHNTDFDKLDTDTDAVVDIHDNCPTVSNTDQKDNNHNGIGDACEDFDHDGVINSKDNCPTVYNPYQGDADGDGIGDFCDETDNRLGAAAPWLPYAGIGIAIFVLGGLGYLTLKLPKQN